MCWTTELLQQIEMAKGRRVTLTTYPVQLLSEKTPAGRDGLCVDKPAPVLIVLP